MSVQIFDFGALKDGRKIEKYVLTNKNGLKASVITYGAALTEFYVPDKNGKYDDILVGFDDLEGFTERSDYQGVTVGPYANRIGTSSFYIDGKKFELTPNENLTTCLHSCGEFNTAVWKAAVVGDADVEFSYIREDMKNGFPGKISVSLIYSLNDENELKLEYNAFSDKKTFINLTNHSYFNLGGFSSGTILNHQLKIEADSFTPVDSLSIPTGKIESVENTPFDFRTFKIIGDRIDDNCPQLEFTGGYDHNFCINNYDGSLKKAASVIDSVSGRVLDVFTDLPGVQFYAGNFLNGTAGKRNLPMEKRTGFCLETQYYPDTPNNPDFPQCLFDAGEKYHSVTVFKLSTR